MNCIYPLLEHGLPPSLNLNHSAYSIFHRIHVRRESMARGSRGYMLTLPELNEWTLTRTALYSVSKKHEKNVAIKRCTESTNCLQSEIYYQEDKIYEISPKKKNVINI